MTDYIYRILLLYPESRRQEVEDWYASTFPDAGQLLTPCGTKDSETWYAASFVATKDDVQQWLDVFGFNLGVEIPPGFVDMSRTVQREWIAGMQSAAVQAIGIWIDAAWNDEGESVDFEGALATLGIERSQVEII